MVLKIISHSAPFVYPQLSQKYDTLKSNKTAMIRVLKFAPHGLFPSARTRHHSGIIQWKIAHKFLAHFCDNS